MKSPIAPPLRSNTCKAQTCINKNPQLVGLLFLLNIPFQVRHTLVGLQADALFAHSHPRSFIQSGKVLNNQGALPVSNEGGIVAWRSEISILFKQERNSLLCQISNTHSTERTSFTQHTWTNNNFDTAQLSTADSADSARPHFTHHTNFTVTTSDIVL
jgi:hypothetical protein